MALAELLASADQKLTIFNWPKPGSLKSRRVVVEAAARTVTRQVWTGTVWTIEHDVSPLPANDIELETAINAQNEAAQNLNNAEVQAQHQDGFAETLRQNLVGQGVTVTKEQIFTGMQSQNLWEIIITPKT